MTTATLIAIAIGGALGAVIRQLLARRGKVGIFIANTAASVVLGALIGFDSFSPVVMAGLGAGVAGALSTWSTLAAQIGEDIRLGHYRAGLTYLLFTVAAGLIGAYVGTLFGTFLAG
ncbi:CrcB family protein [Corynebacterium sp. TAE3-ERU12]|uniref:CrcB family protein n=1 Tax=Corynebacterium sp. TAE3-ERU12 TaxID=2849491 RepID=UPI001C45CFF6|nr:CrcB family protein [Corynebacterium sp. TAE3-ERU12]MBV7294853.1 CrcB family protein [Corynebacterium sp. TAE3-ERU12]